MCSFRAAILIIILTSVNCGDAIEISGRIIGGNKANIEDFNYQVSVREYDRHICGGSIVSANSILTAAHCTEGSYAATLSIRHGATIATNGVKHQVSKIIVHPKYNPASVENDICLLKLRSPIRFSSVSRPIKLTTQRLPDGKNVKISGWGKTNPYQPQNYRGDRQPLRCVTVQIVNQTVCSENYAKTDVKIDNRRMCAAAKGRDSCQGDSGGPLVSGDGFARVQVGICSVGFGCANERFPGIYTFVGAYLDFIKENL